MRLASEIFIENLKAIRKQKGLTQVMLAELADLSPGMIGDIEAGRRNPTLTTMVQPVEEMGRQSVAILADMIEQRRKSCHLRLEACLRPGGSVRKI